MKKINGNGKKSLYCWHKKKFRNKYLRQPSIDFDICKYIVILWRCLQGKLVADSFYDFVSILLVWVARLCIRSILLCEPISLRVTIATSCDAVCSHNRQDLIQSLVQHTMYVINLSNISIKANLKQLIRVEIRLTNLHNTVWQITFCAWRHVICYNSF